MTIENRRRFFLAAAAALTVLGGGLLSACNTVEGVGQDIENAGDAIGDKARKEKRRR